MKKYAYVLNAPFHNETASDNPYPDKIWVSWLQGEENAPALVKKCIASIRKHSAGREVIVITNENIAQYVTFPDFILRKKAKGRISNTHFSDLLRIALLSQYGGIWIDSTVYLTAPLPDYILNAPLFCYKTSHLSPGKIKVSSWFIAAKPHHEIIVRTQAILWEYWKRNNRLCHYYVFHLFFSLVIDTLPHLQQQWHDMPYFNNVNPHVLLLELPEPFKPERWEQIKSISSIHKLTYKISPEHAKRKDTFLQMLLNS
ncbi:MAG: capsular polysaccharide synthesis protein [Odoribacter sp.]|nr:capsular polysaccharide synthesis protein [Odoribacter sp.]